MDLHKVPPYRTASSPTIPHAIVHRIRCRCRLNRDLPSIHRFTHNKKKKKTRSKEESVETSGGNLNDRFFFRWDFVFCEIIDPTIVAGAGAAAAAAIVIAAGRRVIKTSP